MSLARFIKRKKRRAVALATAMLVCLFLLLLTGALVQTQSGVFAMAQSSDAQVRSRAACQSLYDFCLYQLEHDRKWGATPFTSKGQVDPPRADNAASIGLESRLEIRDVNGRTFSGYLSDHGSSFEVEVVNSLTLPGGSSARGMTTPFEQVRFIITAWDGNVPLAKSRSRQQVDCTLRLAPLYDAAVVSRGDVTVEANEVVFASKDPFRNEIRGEGSVSMPGLTSGKTRFVKHDHDVVVKDSDLADMTKDSTGMLWAGRDIKDGVTPLQTEDLPAAALASGGRMVDKATSRADIYELKPENIPQPAFAGDQDITVPPGEFRFTKALATVTFDLWIADNGPQGGSWVRQPPRSEGIDVLEYYDPPDSAFPHKVMRKNIASLPSSERVVDVDIDYGSPRPQGIPVIVGDKFAIDNSFRGSESITEQDGTITDVPEMGFRKIDQLGDSPVSIDLSLQTVKVNSATRVRPAPRGDDSKPPSAFELTVKDGPGGKPGKPTFNLGNGTNDVVIEAEGDISIGEGTTSGLATFISTKGSVTLNPEAQQLKWVEKNINGWPTWVLENEVEIKGHPDYSGLVIYAAKDVNIENISPNADWAIRGFVYARNDFNFKVNSRNATFYGSVVAGNNPSDPGAFKITGGNRATFIYDPDYLKLLTKSLLHDWTRVEPLVWTEANG